MPKREFIFKKSSLNDGCVSVYFCGSYKRDLRLYFRSSFNIVKVGETASSGS